MQTLTQVYQVFLKLLEIYQRRRLSQLSPTFEVQNGASGTMAKYKEEETFLLVKLFDERLFQLDSQLVRKSLISLYESLLDCDCLSAE